MKSLQRWTELLQMFLLNETVFKTPFFISQLTCSWNWMTAYKDTALCFVVQNRWKVSLRSVHWGQEELLDRRWKPILPSNHSVSQSCICPVSDEDPVLFWPHISHISQRKVAGLPLRVIKLIKMTARRFSKVFWLVLYSYVLCDLRWLIATTASDIISIINCTL